MDKLVLAARRKRQPYISQTQISVCLLAGSAIQGKQPIRDLCQATVADQLQQLWHSAEWLEQDDNSNNIWAVIHYNRSRSVKATVGGPVLLFRRQHAVHLGNKVGTRYDSENKCAAFVQSKPLCETSSSMTLNHTILSELYWISFKLNFKNLFSTVSLIILERCVFVILSESTEPCTGFCCLTQIGDLCFWIYTKVTHCQNTPKNWNAVK